MDTDGHGSEMDLTEGVIGSAFEVANALRLGIPGKGLRTGAHPGAFAARSEREGPGFLSGLLQGPTCWRVRRRFGGGGKAYRRVEVRGAFLERAHGAMYQLLEGFRPSGGAAHQLPKT